MSCGETRIFTRDKRIVEAAEAALLARLLDPGKVREMRVSRYSDDLEDNMSVSSVSIFPPHLTVDILKLLDSLRKGDDFSWTNKREVQGIEIDYHVLSLKLRIMWT